MVAFFSAAPNSSPGVGSPSSGDGAVGVSVSILALFFVVGDPEGQSMDSVRLWSGCWVLMLLFRLCS